MPESAQRTALYRLYDADDTLLYVGIAKDVTRRWRMHEWEKKWWHLVSSERIEWFPSRQEARAAELAAMRDESPLYNGVRHPDGTFTQGKYDDTAERDHAAEELRRDLANGTLHPGEMIRIVPLGRRYGVSAMSVAMALLSLPPGTILKKGNYRYVAAPNDAAMRDQ
ncbi:GntR family transcriptional regulator [Streptomyces sp. NPDC002092]